MRAQSTRLPNRQLGCGGNGGTLEPYAVATEDTRWRCVQADDSQAAPCDRRVLARDGIALAFVLAAAIVAYRPLLDLGHLGWDTYPLILTSRIASLTDFFDSFRKELMDGRYPHGHFYRPVTTLSFALDHAAFGLDAFGYHLDQLGLLLACTLGVAALGYRLLGPGVGTLAAALVFALHPLQIETLPVAARRADSLAQLFTLLALVIAPTQQARAAPWRTGLCALCAALAIGSKESGVTLVPLLFALQLAESGAKNWRERVRAALRASALPALGVGLVLLVRAGVLGGLGGHPESSLLAGVGRGLALAPLYAHLLFMPQPLVSEPALARSLVGAAAAALAAALLFSASHRRVRSLLVVCGVWFLTTLWLNGIAGEVASWYALGLLPPFALGIGALAQAAARWAREGRRMRAVLSAVLASLLLAQALRYTPLIHSYPEWPLVSSRSRAFLERAREAASGATPGDVRSVPGLPLGLATPLERVGVRSAIGLADYSVEAWAELSLPAPRLVVVLGDGSRRSAPRPDAVVIDTTPDLAQDSLR